MTLAAERSELQIEKAQMDRELNYLARDEAMAQLKTYKVEAPFAGIVTRVHKRQGEAVRQGDPILELVNTDRVRVEGDVKISQIWNIRRGDLVKVQLEIPNFDLDVEKLTFEGRIVFVDVSVEPVSGTVRVWAEVENSGNLLRAGLSAKMTIYPQRTAVSETVSHGRKK